MTERAQSAATPRGGTTGSAPDFDVAIIGAGFAGLYMLHRLRQLGFRAHVYEAGTGVGGTWYWNRYPGARCDVESMEYSYQFSADLQQQWEWSERYAAQPEILQYANHVADRFDLRRDITFNTRIQAARFDAGAGRWAIDTGAGTGRPVTSVTATHCVMATGCLSSTNRPDFKGLERFRGDWYHTGEWPHAGVDFTGKRVGIIGTGSSAVQSIPIIARQAAHLHVFQRTPNYVVPARNGPMDAQYQRAFKADYPKLRQEAKQNRNGLLYGFRPISALEVSAEERTREYQARWDKGGLLFMGAYQDLILDRRANNTAADFVREKIRQVVQDPAVADLLCPDTVLGAKRLCVDTGYFETFNRDNVTLVDVSEAPVEEITETGLIARGEAFELDIIVFATGFDAMTGALNRIDIRAGAGQALKDKWAAGPRTYLGLMSAGFPNLFTITGPGSPSVLTNMLPSIEQHVEWIADCLAHLRERGLARIDATVDAEDAWVDHVNAVAGRTLFPQVNSWYLGANVPGKPRVFMPYIGFPAYVQKCEEVVREGYAGFVLA